MGTGGVTVAGQVASINDVSGDITLQLIPEGLSEPAYETIVKGNTVDYYFADAAAGTYTLKAMKAGHITAEYTLSVGSENVTRLCDPEGYSSSQKGRCGSGNSLNIDSCLFVKRTITQQSGLIQMRYGLWLTNK